MKVVGVEDRREIMKGPRFPMNESLEERFKCGLYPTPIAGCACPSHV